MNSWDRMPGALKEQVFSHLSKLAAVANLSEADRIAYDKALDRFYVNRIVEDDIRRESLEKGRAEGLEKGRAEGQLKEKYDNARKLKQMGIPVETLAKALGLPIEEIERL